MSAFMCSDTHLSIITEAYAAWALLEPYASDRHAADVWRCLAEENAKSVAFRYREAPAPVSASGMNRDVRLPSAIAVVKLCQSLEYQSCEHDGWETSEARRIVRAVLSAAISRVDGYDAAPWSI